jgi:Fe-S cluster biogenesis protein NfuA
LLVRSRICYHIKVRNSDKNNKKSRGGKDEMRENVEKALDKIRPALRADGGDIELIDVVDGVVKVRLTGACGGCPMSQMTLKMGVEKVLKQQVPEVKSVETV